MSMVTTVLALLLVTIGYAGGWFLGLNAVVMIVIALAGILLGFSSMNDPGDNAAMVAVFLGSFELVITVIILALGLQ